ncbi:hypothetical protein AALP_AA8G037200 [Arabis alpina]|uniref:S-protein homolog n=1 Tax=Arabis alpina TaxID=50452 RepID=A0A087G4T2_ARAAL|nr:hypothetical protein AALP_AA8G037200 [Arabis alpina]
MKRLTIFALIILGLCVGDTFGHKNVLMVVNKLNSRVRVHCHSRNDDFKVQILYPHDPPLLWRFGDTFIVGTKINCEFKYGYEWMHSVSFVAYRTSWSDSNQPTNNATWIVEKLGLFLSYNYRTPEFRYRWV